MKYLLDNEETNRLKFRLLKQSDFDIWINLFKEDKVAQFLGFDTSKSPIELCEIWFEKVFYRYENDLGGMNVLIDKNTGTFVGQCGLLIQTVENIDRLEIGYSLLPEHWGKGYATEAAVKCKNFAFEKKHSDSLISIVHIENIASQKVALNNGMRIEKRLESYKGNPVDIFQINRTQWKASH